MYDTEKGKQRLSVGDQDGGLADLSGSLGVFLLPGVSDKLRAINILKGALETKIINISQHEQIDIWLC